MSLRVRLALAMSAVAFVALVAADVVTYSSLRSFLYGQVDQTLVASVPQAGQNAQLPGGGSQPSAQPGGNAGPGPVGPRNFFEVRSPTGAVVAQSEAYQADGKRYAPRLPRTVSGWGTVAGVPGTAALFDAPSTVPGGPEFRVLAQRQPGGSVVFIGASLTGVDSTLGRLVLIEGVVTACAFLGALVIGWWLVRLGLRPLVAMETTAEVVATGGLDQRVPGEDNGTEVGRLARALNVMLGRIQGAFAQRDATEAELRRSEARLRRFVADASHELRTPVAAVAAYAELFERGARERPEDLGRVVRGIRGETARMAQLVEDLLLLTRLDEGRPLERVPVELVALAAESLATGHAVGPRWPVSLEADEPVEITGDGSRLRQVIDNLLGNVRAHTPEGTPATVRVLRNGDEAVVEVADCGPGLTEEAAHHVFERFYRSDPSRSRAKGGSGLGLSIVAAIVTAHGGHVSVRPRPGGGAVFTVCLPLAESSRSATATASSELPQSPTVRPQSPTAPSRSPVTQIGERE